MKVRNEPENREKESRKRVQKKDLGKKGKEEKIDTLKSKKVKDVETIKKEVQEQMEGGRLVRLEGAWWKEIAKELRENAISPKEDAPRKKSATGESETSSNASLSLQEATKLASSLFGQQIQLFANVQKSRRGSDVHYLNVMLRKGTLSDRLASMTVIVQENPVHSFNVLKMLLSLVNKNQRREAGLAIEAMKELFILNLMPARKLTFAHFPPFFSTI